MPKKIPILKLILIKKIYFLNDIFLKKIYTFLSKYLCLKILKKSAETRY
jgi:hypothetical protein